MFFLCHCSYFNPRPRKEGDQSFAVFANRHRHFNPRPRKEGDQFGVKRFFVDRYFNPRPRKEGDVKIHTDTLFFLISIHALAKRATTLYSLAPSEMEISIHALVKRATDEVGAMDSYPIISIHALVKRATRRRYRAHTHRRISIHALVKRATFLILSLVLRHSNFNPRPREEGDVCITTTETGCKKFQSTPS